MAPRQSTGLTPPADASTYRDLLLFEERLKTNALLLNRRKSKYQFFLAHLLAIIAFLLNEVLFHTEFLSVPYRYILRQSPPDDVHLPPYFPSALLFVAVTTLLLFFASGMYAEKIGYANRYVPHANRALRSFNMYLNVRRPPLRSSLPLSAILSSLFSRSAQTIQSPASSVSPIPTQTQTRSRSASPPRKPRSPSLHPTIPTIPPTTNPRGELIFSSRVDKAFRDGYERYRASFERRRTERERALFERTWLGCMWTRIRGRGGSTAKESMSVKSSIAGEKEVPSRTGRRSRTGSIVGAASRGRGTYSGSSTLGRRSVSPIDIDIEGGGELREPAAAARGASVSSSLGNSVQAGGASASGEVSASAPNANTSPGRKGKSRLGLVEESPAGNTRSRSRR